MAWVFLLIATLSSWIAFIVNIVFAALTKNRVKNNTNGQYVGKYGNAIWISLAGAILMTLAMVMALFGSCCCIKRKKVVEEEHKPAHDVEAEAAYDREASVEGSHDVSAEKLSHETPVEVAPKKGFSFPWGKKKTHAEVVEETHV